jgi:hypothetical protein
MEPVELLPRTLRKDSAHYIVVCCFGENEPAPSEEMFEAMLESIDKFLGVFYKHLAPVPTTKEINKIKKQTDTLLKTLQDLDHNKQYEGLIEKLTLSRADTRNLEERRKDIRKQPNILTPEIQAISNKLCEVWYEYKKEWPTGTYDNRFEHDNNHPANRVFDWASNPGAYFIQATLREYFAVDYTNKQIKDLIQSLYLPNNE